MMNLEFMLFITCLFLFEMIVLLVYLKHKEEKSFNRMQAKHRFRLTLAAMFEYDKYFVTVNEDHFKQVTKLSKEEKQRIRSKFKKAVK